MDPAPPIFRFPVPDADHGRRYVACSDGGSSSIINGFGPSVPEPTFSSDPNVVDEILYTFLSSPPSSSTATAAAISPSTLSMSPSPSYLPPSSVPYGSQNLLVEPRPVIRSFGTTTGGSGIGGILRNDERIQHDLGPQNQHPHITSQVLCVAGSGMRRRVSSMSSSTTSSTLPTHDLHHRQNQQFKRHGSSESFPSLVLSDPSTGPNKASLMPSRLLPLSSSSSSSSSSVSPTEMSTEMSMTEAGFKQDSVSKSSSSSTSSDDRHHRDRDDGRWMTKFKQLRDFKGQQGHCHIPINFKDNPSLSKWAKRQRYQYKLKAEGKHSTMTLFRQRLLEDLGFLWNIRCNVWDTRYDELVDFNVLHGHCNVPIKYVPSPKLGTWVKCQRRQYNLFMKGQKSNMTDERIERLNRLNFQWYGGGGGFSGGSIAATEKSFRKATSSQMEEPNESRNPDMVGSAQSAAQTGPAAVLSTSCEDVLREDENNFLLLNIEPEPLNCISNDDDERQHQQVDDVLLDNLHEFVRFASSAEGYSFET